MTDKRRPSLGFDDSEDLEEAIPERSAPINTSVMGSKFGLKYGVEDHAVDNNIGIGAELLQSIAAASIDLKGGRTPAVGSGKGAGGKVGRSESIEMRMTTDLDTNLKSSGDKLISSQFNATAALLGVPNDTEMEEKLVDLENDMNTPFDSQFKPTEMRQLALVAHNHMKPAMKAFIESNAEILKKFRITGTNTTMTMCRTVFGDDPNVVYGATCSSGPLGGDAQLAALMVLEDVGGIVFFIDPLSAHPHQADIDSLVRLANVGNILLTTNPATSGSMMYLLRCAMKEGKKEMFPSFFQTLESPAVPEYKAEQARALQKAIDS